MQEYLISQIGEKKIIEQIKELCENISENSPSLELGIGDDCAIFPIATTGSKKIKENGLITTDLLIETVHFSEETISMYELGKKAMEVNVSDIAAMGGKPFYSTISIAMNSETPYHYISSLYSGLNESAKRHGIKIVGGDTSSSPGVMFISITLIGRVEKGNELLRSKAQSGDLVCVSGDIGASYIGLRWLLSGLEKDTNSNSSDLSFINAVNYCIKKHTTPIARINAGGFLANSGLCHSCIDLSDGLATDLSHILKESNVGARINLETLPIHPQTKRVAQVLSIDMFKAATTGGEDYELLFTIPPSSHQKVEEGFKKLKIPFTIIGTINDKPKHLDFYMNEKLFEYNLEGYQHFKS